jgi:hypothetical protein
MSILHRKKKQLATVRGVQGKQGVVAVQWHTALHPYQLKMTIQGYWGMSFPRKNKKISRLIFHKRHFRGTKTKCLFYLASTQKQKGVSISQDTFRYEETKKFQAEVTIFAL